MTRYLSEELSAKLRDCVTDDGIILTKKLEKSLTYEEQWALVMAYMGRIRRQKLRRDTSAAIGEVKAAVARNDLPAASEALKGVYLSTDSNILEMTKGEASERCVEIMAIQDGLNTARERLSIALKAMEQASLGSTQKLVDAYPLREIADLVAGMPE